VGSLLHAADIQKRPIHEQNRPIHTQKRPIHTPKRPIHIQKRPNLPVLWGLFCKPDSETWICMRVCLNSAAVLCALSGASVLWRVLVCVLHCVEVCCSVLQFVAVCCSALQCVAVRKELTKKVCIHLYHFSQNVRVYMYTYAYIYIY